MTFQLSGLSQALIGLLYICSFIIRSGGGIVDNTLDYQSRDRKIDPHFSSFSDETLKRGPTLSLTHSLSLLFCHSFYLLSSEAYLFFI